MRTIENIKGWSKTKQGETGYGGLKLTATQKSCLKCDVKFPSYGKNNRICEGCQKSNGYIYSHNAGIVI